MHHEKILAVFQAKDLTQVTHKVYFDIEIDGKPAGLW
jgi:peptidylprolyl isomerase